MPGALLLSTRSVQQTVKHQSRIAGLVPATNLPSAGLEPTSRSPRYASPSRVRRKQYPWISNSAATVLRTITSRSSSISDLLRARPWSLTIEIPSSRSCSGCVHSPPGRRIAIVGSSPDPSKDMTGHLTISVDRFLKKTVSLGYPPMSVPCRSTRRVHWSAASCALRYSFRATSRACSFSARSAFARFSRSVKNVYKPPTTAIATPPIAPTQAPMASIKFKSNPHARPQVDQDPSAHPAVTPSPSASKEIAKIGSFSLVHMGTVSQASRLNRSPRSLAAPPPMELGLEAGNTTLRATDFGNRHEQEQERSSGWRGRACEPLTVRVQYRLPERGRKNCTPLEERWGVMLVGARTGILRPLVRGDYLASQELRKHP